MYGSKSTWKGEKTVVVVHYEKKISLDISKEANLLSNTIFAIYNVRIQYIGTSSKSIFGY